MTPKRDNRPDRGGRGPARRDSGQQNRGRRDDRDRYQKSDRHQKTERKSITAVPSGDLPKWVREEITRSTPKDRREPAITHLARAVSEFADDRYGAAYEQLRKAKDLAPQAATIRELLGLSAYHLEHWQEALRELRTFRRITGEATQVPVELDCLRALGRTEDLEKTYRNLSGLDPRPETDDEARVVYASSLLDRDLLTDAWKVIKPGRLVSDPRPSALRRWYVAARVAVAAGDLDTARTLADAIADNDTDFPGLIELRSEIGD